jgi:hypothetical protein
MFPAFTSGPCLRVRPQTIHSTNQTRMMPMVYYRIAVVASLRTFVRLLDKIYTGRCLSVTAFTDSLTPASSNAVFPITVLP